ncbi:MAG TPA: DUF6064 family protein [Gemmatimonadales bacterium]|nr:DUF6064 family protein [Gemmatimonadales bacterium]
MPEWWTYGLSDFLLFAPRTYYRLIERHNAALWPAHVVTLATGLVAAVLVRRPAPGRSRAAAALLAAVWAWVGWAFVARRYATINWAATYLALLFAVETLLLGWIAAAPGGLRIGRRRGATRAPAGARKVAGAALFGFALLLYPLLAPVLGRDWSQAEVFGVAPDPTALGTLGVLLRAEGLPRGVLLAAPVLWCLLSGATLWAMGSAEAWIVLSGASLALAVAVSEAKGPRGP